LAGAVLAKARAFTMVVAAVEASRVEAEQALAACKTPDEVHAVLANLRASAEARAAALGLS
jgi:hypothetical protein